jgi:hypothetical protein
VKRLGIRSGASGARPAVAKNFGGVQTLRLVLGMPIYALNPLRSAVGEWRDAMPGRVKKLLTSDGAIALLGALVVMVAIIRVAG